ncbi:uncharacterized protein FTJAE_7888 [Fusarium tjaetaba]|uniref:Uncharacterized protein n=1 Tax=Fusarium tjaetaba TaxID=1567544 RepID=A0A8H5RE90_9HYPO|nr:uncharacterized protein FTJAE_7888 [Fusarium tjaetaba]KAF5631485.1 hypothetical protein FTJAE_7888 [Fusarium tjaetaba]
MESKSYQLLKTGAPENRVAKDQLHQVATPEDRTVPSHGKCMSTSLNRRVKLTFVRDPDTVATFLDEANICWGPAVPSFSKDYPTSTDVIMRRLPRYQPLMLPVVMSPNQDGRLLMAHPRDRLQSEIEDLKAQHQSGGQGVSQRQSKWFWVFLSLRKLILVAAFALIMFVAFVAVTIALASYIAPSLLQLNDMMGVQNSEVKVHEIAARGPNSVWDPHGRPASPLASASGATFSLTLKVVSAWVEVTQDIAGIFLFGRLQ